MARFLTGCKSRSLCINSNCMEDAQTTIPHTLYISVPEDCATRVVFAPNDTGEILPFQFAPWSSYAFLVSDGYFGILMHSVSVFTTFPALAVFSCL
jgi:hypothetical protein